MSDLDEGRALLREATEALLGRLMDGTYSPRDLVLAEQIATGVESEVDELAEMETLATRAGAEHLDALAELKRLLRENAELRRQADRRYRVQVVCAGNPGPTLIDVYDAVTGDVLFNSPVDVRIGLAPDPMPSANPSITEALAWLWAVASSSTSLSARPAQVLVEHLGALGARAEGPDDGHTFEITWRLRGSYAVTGEPHHDADYWSEPITRQVRAWSLDEALAKARAIPLAAWMTET